ncbi:glutathione peroxidase [Exilibacterium tricleocarpae]|uniref:Glutathione peroxidase n=1 Tax=Exilibacterium tricleocarpae TaxID=2591008 RepID=A0A545TS35_9GAMM|nr:glutathione peroxidase [Exilibacterium tricleocarpae]TQV80029.1 glutathione peroxidase [Exilibacterium tricleocarpae]
MSSVYDFQADLISGERADLTDFKDKVLLIVNTASKCGFTPQYQGLEALYQSYKDRGFEILGFPCNQFGNQEPGNSDDISKFCELNFGVTFPLFAKVAVNGDDAHPLFRHLKSQARGILGSQRIKWNFTKFLVNREGEVVKRFAPTDKPAALAGAIEPLL